MKNTFENQNKIRLDNQLKVYNLIKYNDYSCTDLAKVLNLSNTALANIVSDLENAEIIRISNKTNKTVVGRRPIYYELNDNIGLFAALDMSLQKIRICISDITGKILKTEYYKETLFISKKDIYNIIDILKEMYASLSGDLKVVCIGTPGKINKENGSFIFAPRFIDYNTINIYEMFSQAFDSLIIIKNDINLSLIGESTYGVTKNVPNAIFLHIDYNYGGAIQIDNKLFEGEHGFAGEFGEIRALGDNDLKYTSTYFTASAITMLVNEKIKSLRNSNKELTFIEIAELYNADEQLVCEVVNQAALSMAIIINNFVSAFDVDTYVLNGGITILGQKYLNTIMTYFNQYYDNSLPIKVCYSKLKDTALIMGGLSYGIDTYVEKTLKAIRQN